VVKCCENGLNVASNIADGGLRTGDRVRLSETLVLSTGMVNI